MIKRYFGTKSFYYQIICIAIPIMGQQFISAFVSLIDNVMIGSMGEVTMTAVTIANRYFLIMNSILFGICGGAGIYIAQYYGAKKVKQCQKVFNLNMLFSLGGALVFTVVLIFIPEFMVGLFSKTPTIMKSSLEYLDYTKFTYIPFAISFTCMMALRTVGINTIQLKIGSIAVISNTFLNYCLIFGNLGFPEMGIQGAAIATLFSRLLEMSIYLVILIRQQHFFRIDIKELLKIDISLVIKIFRKSLFLILNELLFSVGLAIVFKAYIRCDEYLVASISIVDTVTNIMYIAFSGLSSAVAITIGNRLGANMFDEAKNNAYKLLGFTLIISLIVSGCCFLIAPYVPNLYNIDVEIKEVAIVLIRIKAVVINAYAFNVCVFFILRAGGDVLSTVIMDAGFLWGINIVVVTILSVYTNLPLVYLYMIIEGLDIVKTVIAIFFFKKERWVKNITVMEG